jgi:hypothetical protein
MSSSICVKLNVDLNGIRKGSIISLETTDEGKIKDIFWNNRLNDGCVNVVDSVKPNNSVSKKQVKAELKYDNS